MVVVKQMLSAVCCAAVVGVHGLSVSALKTALIDSRNDAEDFESVAASALIAAFESADERGNNNDFFASSWRSFISAFEGSSNNSADDADV